MIRASLGGADDAGRIVGDEVLLDGYLEYNWFQNIKGEIVANLTIRHYQALGKDNVLLRQDAGTNELKISKRNPLNRLVMWFKGKFSKTDRVEIKWAHMAFLHAIYHSDESWKLDVERAKRIIETDMRTATPLSSRTISRVLEGLDAPGPGSDLNPASGAASLPRSFDAEVFLTRAGREVAMQTARIDGLEEQLQAHPDLPAEIAREKAQLIALNGAATVQKSKIARLGRQLQAHPERSEEMPREHAQLAALNREIALQTAKVDGLEEQMQAHPDLTGEIARGRARIDAWKVVRDEVRAGRNPLPKLDSDAITRNDAEASVFKETLEYLRTQEGLGVAEHPDAPRSEAPHSA